MKRLGLMMAALAAAVTVGIFAGASGGPSQAQDEEPVELGDIYFINPSVCLALTRFLNCQNGVESQILANGREVVRDGALDEDKDGEVTREEVNRFNRSGNHIHQRDGSIMIVVFVDDDEPVRFDTDRGLLKVSSTVESSEFLCSGDPGFPFFDRMTHDEDCDDDGIRGDGLLWAQLLGADDDQGTGELRITDEGDGEEIGIFNFELVGETHNIVAAPFETVLGAGVDPDDTQGCALPTTVAGFTEALGNSNKAVVIARAEDIDGDNIIGAWVEWTVKPADEDKVKFGAPQTPTLDLGSFGFGAPQVICGLEGSGEIEVTIKFVPGALGISSFDTQHRADSETFTVTLTAIPAAMDFTVTPAVLNCDGVAGAEVAASVTTADGDPVANGTEVKFDVSVLGIASPIVATTTDGVAKTTVTPLAIENTGVPVIVTIGPDRVGTFPLAPEGDGIDNDEDGDTDEVGERDNGPTVPNRNQIVDSTIVQCGTGSAPVDPAQPQPGAPSTGGEAGGGQTGVIRGPDTGSGGNAAPRPMSAWPVVALFAGAMALAGARFALKRG